MKDFYIKNFGFKVFSEKTIKGSYPDKLLCLFGTNLTYVKLKAEEGILELIHFNNPKMSINYATFNHFALTVNNLEELYKKLKKQGIYFYSEPIKAPDSNVKICFCLDPEGNRIELVEDLE
jgi:predicted enzyme related to lactoylglutathione lyase